MLHTTKKLEHDDIVAMRALKENGVTHRELAEKFDVSPSTIQYHLNENYREQSKIRAKKANLKYSQTPKGKAKAAAFMKSPAGKKSIAKSWIRNYLNHGYITTEDVKEVLEEFK